MEERKLAGLGVGQEIIYFELPDQQDYPWSLSGQLEMGPVVLVFYMGDWSPYCNGQLASYARRFEEFESRGAQVAAISVDPPPNNARMVGKLLIPFPLLSDPEGVLARRCGLWDAEEGVAVPSTVIVDRPGEVSYLYVGKDYADRPEIDEALGVLDGLEGGIERLTGGPELQVGAEQARQGRDHQERPAMELEQLTHYYRGVYFTTRLFEERLTAGGGSGKKAFGEMTPFQRMVNTYIEALEETISMH